MTEHLRIIASCVYLEVFQITSFTPLENSLFYVQVAEFQPPDRVKKYFISAFKAFYTRTSSSYSKAFIYLKSMKIICEEVNLSWSCEMPTWELTKKTLSHILLSVFCLHSLRIHHDYFFRRGFESAARFFQEI